MDLIKTSKVDNVRLLDPIKKNKAVVGTLHLTTTHLIFIDPHGAKETWVLHSHIAAIERLPLTAAGSPLRVRTKTFRVVTFVISRERDCVDVYATLLSLSSPVGIEDLYAFHYSPQEDKLTQSAGWQLYDATTEFNRMGTPQHLWIETKLNRDYKICETYPQTLYVPASSNATILVGCAQFRSKQRIPTLSYYHSKNQAAMCRCAQPLSGFNTRSAEDEQMLQSIIKSNPKSKDMYIIDTRPKINAMANRAAGKGYENVENYDNVKFQFIGIENIHKMRESLQKMLEVAEATDASISTYLNGLESSSYLKHIKAILDTSVFIAKAIEDEGSSVLVHCSDGWDRTAQTCSLSSIMLDPYYRTIHGFQVLVEKEWLSFGHKFVDRCGFIQGDPKEVSPICTQFLDCVWQLQQQFLTAFQFNERFLLTLHDHVYSCQFGTFLGNCDKQRREFRLSERTYSLWGYMWQHISEYINPFYKDGQHGILIPSTAPQTLRPWRGLYNRFDNELHPKESIPDTICSLTDHNDSLRDHIRWLTKKVEALKRLSDVSTPTEKVKPELNSNSITDQTKTSEENQQSDDENPGLILNERAILKRNVAPDDSGTENEQKSLNSPTSQKFPDIASALEDLPTFAIEWKPIRALTQCSCGTPMDNLSRKIDTHHIVSPSNAQERFPPRKQFHCWNCGNVFCSRCIERQSSLPGHYSENKVPVCKPCYKSLKSSVDLLVVTFTEIDQSQTGNLN